MRITVRVYKLGEPVSGAKVALWWQNAPLSDSGSAEYTENDGRATFNYPNGAWPGDAVEIYINDNLMQSYDAPKTSYEFEL